MATNESTKTPTIAITKLVTAIVSEVVMLGLIVMITALMPKICIPIRPAIGPISGVYGSQRITIVRPTLDDEEQAITLLARYPDKQYSFADAISLVTMERQQIGHAFSYDADFAQYGWTMLR